MGDAGERVRCPRIASDVFQEKAGGRGDTYSIRPSSTPHGPAAIVTDRTFPHDSERWLSRAARGETTQGARTISSTPPKWVVSEESPLDSEERIPTNKKPDLEERQRVEPLGRYSRFSAETWCAISLVGLAFAGYLKDTPIFNWLPIDPTAFFAGSCLVAWFAYANRTGQIFLPSMRASVLLWLAFLPGVVLNILLGFDAMKIAYLFTTTLLCVLLPAVVGTSGYAQRAWLYGLVVVGLALGLGTLLFTNQSYLERTGRLSIEGGSAARPLGAVVVVMVALSLMSTTGRRRRVALLLVAIFAVILMSLIGSRGPFVSMVVAVPLMIATGLLSLRKRFVGIVSVVILVVILAAYQEGSSSTGWSRIVTILSGDVKDTNRELLYSIGYESIWAHPEGLGWSGFDRISPMHGYVHNIELEIFVEGGWVAGIAFLLYAFSALRRLRKNSSEPYGMVLYGLAIYWVIAAQFSGDINGNRVALAALAYGFSALATQPVDRNEYTRGRRLRTGRSILSNSNEPKGSSPRARRPIRAS